MDILYSWKVMYLQYKHKDEKIDNNHPMIVVKDHPIFKTKEAKTFEAGWLACQVCAVDFFNRE